MIHKKPLHPQGLSASIHNSTTKRKGAEGLIDSCMDRIFFEEAKRKKNMKEEMIYSLQLLLKKYPSLKNLNTRNR
jgi:hypothetical protein